MSSGGSVLNPTVTLTAPDDLTGMPKKIEIRAIAEADVDGVISVVHQDTLVLNVEKIDVYQPPVFLFGQRITRFTLLTPQEEMP